MANTTERIELTIDIFDARQQRALARPALTPDELVAAIQQEFCGDPDQIYLGAQPENYCLIRAATGQPLADGRPLAEQGLPKGERLVLTERAPAQPSGATAPSTPAYLRDQATGFVYRLHWLPTLIGRSGQLTDSARLAVNLSGHPQWTRVSRRHARISEERGQIMIENLIDANPIVLRDSQGQETLLTPHKRYTIHDRDTIVLTNSGIELRVLIRSNV
jgi:hypothetical protein